MRMGPLFCGVILTDISPDGSTCLSHGGQNYRGKQKDGVRHLLHQTYGACGKLLGCEAAAELCAPPDGVRIRQRGGWVSSVHALQAVGEIGLIHGFPRTRAA